MQILKVSFVILNDPYYNNISIGLFEYSKLNSFNFIDYSIQKLKKLSAIQKKHSNSICYQILTLKIFMVNIVYGVKIIIWKIRLQVFLTGF